MDLNIRNMPEDLMKVLKVEAMKGGMSLRAKVIDILRAGLCISFEQVEPVVSQVKIKRGSLTLRDGETVEMDDMEIKEREHLDYLESRYAVQDFERWRKAKPIWRSTPCPKHGRQPVNGRWTCCGEG